MSTTLSHKRWASALLLLVGALTGSVIGVNAVTDPYAVLRTDLSRQYQEPNLRFLKIKHLLAHKDEYDSFLFGSSRALQIDTDKIPGGRYYNFGTSEGIPQEHLQHVEFLLAQGIKVRNVMIALDDFSYRLYPERHLTDLLRQPHYLVSGKGRVEFYAGYLVKLQRFLPAVRDYGKANCTEAGKREAQRTFYDVYGTGRVICRTCDDEIERDPAAHDRDPRFTRPRLHYTENNLESALDSLAKLVSLCSKNGIKLTLFINPLHRVSYLDTDLPLFFEFKRRLAELSSYYDFSGLNSVTTNNRNYYEASHFRVLVGDRMLSRMFGYPPVSVPRDFGVLVTAGNVEAHIREQQAEIAKDRSASQIPVASPAQVRYSGAPR